jgi:predicted phage tail protein
MPLPLFPPSPTCTPTKKQYTIEGVPQPRTFSPLKVTDFVVDIPGLEPGARYVFNVRAVNSRNGSSSVATTRTTMPSPARCQGAPRPPAQVQTRSDSPTTLTVSWLAEANDPCIERYEVTYVLQGQTIAPRSLAPLYVTEKTVTLTGLQPGSTYSIVIASVGKNGQRSSVTTTGRTQPNCSPLRAPAAVSVRQVQARAVQMTWENPQPQCIRNIQVTYQDRSNGNRGPTTQLSGTDRQFTFGNLQPGREYQFSVRYVGRDGTQSAPSSANLFLANNSQGGTVVVGGR